MGFQPLNMASLVSKSIWNISDIQTPGRLNLVPGRGRLEEAVEFEVYVQLPWCNVCFNNLFSEAFHLGLFNSEVVSNQQSLKPRID